MTCPNCGSENRPGTRFCFHCGTALTAESPEPAPVGTGAVSSEPEAQAPPPVYAQPGPSAPQPAPGAWQAPPPPQPAQFNAPIAPPWLQQMTRHLSAAGPAFRGITAPLGALTAPLAPAGKLVVAAVGSILLVLGTFLPTLSGFGGSWNYWYLFKFTAIFLLVLAVVNVLMALMEQYTWLWITASLSLLLVLLSFFDVILAPAGFPGVSWGWIIIWIGVIAMIAAAAMPPTKPSWLGSA